MATISSLRSRQEAILSQYHEHLDFVLTVQRTAIEELIPMLVEEAGPDGTLDPAAMALIQHFLEDPVTVFRFCRRARFSLPASLDLLRVTLSYRLATSFLSLAIDTENGNEVPAPLFFFHPELFDRFGRPCAILNLREVKRTDDGELEVLKQFIRVGWEIGRRWLGDQSRVGRKGKGKEREGEEGEGKEVVKVQMVVMVDLEGAGMSNLEVELLPFFMDLLKNHFPGMVGAIFVLNYGWMYAGMWQLAKRVLPNTALERILFPTKSELLQFFDEDHLLVEHGGTVSYTYTSSNPILKKYTTPRDTSSASAYPSPAASPAHSLPPSRSTSYESIPDVFHSAPNTPRVSTIGLSTFAAGQSMNFGPGMRRSTTGLSMTSLTGNALGLGTFPSSQSFTALQTSTSRPSLVSLGSMRRIPSLIDIQMYLGETQAAIESDDSGDETSEDERWEIAQGRSREEESENEEEHEGDENESRQTSRATSRNVSRVASREPSPAKMRREGTFSSRAVKFSGKSQLSPYNTSNPYYGYPAFYPPNSTLGPPLTPSATSPPPLSNALPVMIPRPHYHRRRKRDLIRTLTYLAVLRFLALHRHLQKQLRKALELVWSGLSTTPSGISAPSSGGASRSKEEEAEERKELRKKKAIKVIYAFLLLIILRMPITSRVVEFVLRLSGHCVPSGVGSFISGRGAGAERATIGYDGMRTVERGKRKRDVLVRLFGMMLGGEKRM